MARPQTKADLIEAAGQNYDKLLNLIGSMTDAELTTTFDFSDDPKKIGRPRNFDITVREAYVSAGAGFVVALTGSIVTMPGLPKRPAAFDIDVDDNGKIVGLF